MALVLALAAGPAAGQAIPGAADRPAGEPDAETAQRRLDDFQLDRGETPALPHAPSAEAMDEATAAAYRESLRAYYAYRMAGYDHRLRVFEWQNLSTKIIFVVVLLLVFLGIYFAAIQFHVGLRRRGPDGHPPPHEESSEIALSFKGLRIRSPVLGVIVLTISLAFFYLYLVYVYPIETVF